MSLQKSTLEQVKRAGSALVDARKALADDFKAVMEQMTSSIITQPAGRDLDRQFSSVKDMARLAHEMAALEERVKDILLSAMALAERGAAGARTVARTEAPRLLGPGVVADAVVVVDVTPSVPRKAQAKKVPAKKVPAKKVNKAKRAGKSTVTAPSAPVAVTTPAVSAEPKKASPTQPVSAKARATTPLKAPTSPAPAEPTVSKKARSKSQPKAAPTAAGAQGAGLSSNESKVLAFAKTRLSKTKPAALTGKDVGTGAGIPAGSVSLALKQLVAKGKLVTGGDGMYKLG